MRIFWRQTRIYINTYSTIKAKNSRSIIRASTFLYKLLHTSPKISKVYWQNGSPVPVMFKCFSTSNALSVTSYIAPDGIPMITETPKVPKMAPNFVFSETNLVGFHIRSRRSQAIRTKMRLENPMMVCLITSIPWQTTSLVTSWSSKMAV